MTKEILILRGKVVDVAETRFPVSPEFQWVTDHKDDGTIKHGYLFDGFNFSAPPAPPKPSVDELRREEYQKIDAEGMEAMRIALENIYAEQAGLAIPKEFSDYLEKVDAVKAKHPK